jgi:hypothetical protein
MTLSFSTPAVERVLHDGKPQGGAASGGPASHGGSGFNVFEPEMEMKHMKMKVSIPFTMDDKVNPVPCMQKVLEVAQQFDARSSLQSSDPMCSPIVNVADIAKLPDPTKYAMDLQSNAIKKQFQYFIILETSVAFPMLKQSTPLYSWLRETKHFLNPHAMHSNYVSEIGFLAGVHPTLSSRDAINALLRERLGQIPYNLLPASDFFIDPHGKKVNTKVVKIQTESKDAATAREVLSRAFMNDQALINALAERSTGIPIQFVPTIKKNIMDVATYREALHYLPRSIAPSSQNG